MGSMASLATFMGFVFVTANSIVAIHRSQRDVAAISFVVASYLTLVLLFLCLRRFETAPPNSVTRDRAKVGVWLLTTLLTTMFSWRVSVIMPWLVAGADSRALQGGQLPRLRRSSRRPTPSERKTEGAVRASRQVLAMEVEAAKCECCGFTEECTPQYIAAVKGEYLGRWICGLCAEAVSDEIRRAGAGEITTAEALDQHVAFARAALRAPGRAAEDDLVAAVARLLRRCLDSPPASPIAPQGRKVAAGPGCPDGEDA